MAEALADRGHEVHVVTYHLGSGPVSSGVEVHRIRDIPGYQKLSPGPTYYKLLRVDPPLARLLRRLLKQHRFDVVHAHHYEGLLVGAAARSGIPVRLVYDAHTLLMSELPYYPLGLPQGVKRHMGRWLDALLPRIVDHTVCVTDTIREKLVQDAGMDAGRVSVIANGVEYDHFAAAIQADSVSTDGRTLVFTGNLAEYQGIEIMLEAFAQVLKQVPDARLLIASDSSFAAYESQARTLGITESLDIIPSPDFRDLPALLARADVAVNPRVECDGVPVKLLNYMAAGRAVVSFASSAPGVVHQETGWLVESGSVPALAEGMITLLKQPALARRLGDAARHYVEENCSWHVVARRCESLYERLLAGTT
jgi:glycosyltransferase involved in cell wall biosynthesis